jgi:predicted nucleotidyltransferase
MIKSYNISSENFSNPLLKELLQVLTDFFNSVNSEFYVIGATARDIILSGIHKQVPARKTNDLDIAIAIPNWSMFQKITEGLCNIDGFSKSREQTQRFFYKTHFQLDIVPFGEIAHADNLIYWPPEESQVMSVAGFTDVVKHALEINVDDDLIIKVATLPGIFILKLNAWKSRNIETNRDADDMAFIISSYLDINEQRAVTENYDIYEADDFSTFVAGATLLGRDMKGILRNNPGILNEFAGILKAEVDKKENSLLINQMLETHQLLEYEKVNDALISITNELNTYTLWPENEVVK